MTNNFKIVEVEWEDITHLSKAKDIEFVKDNKFLSYKTVGYLIYEDEEMISIAFSCVIYDEKMQEVEPINDFEDILNIPRRAIKKIKILKEENGRQKRKTSLKKR